MRPLILAAAALALPGCGGMLAPGEWGTFRYFGQLQGEAPLRLVPPVSDRAGNTYVLYGDDTVPSEVYVGHRWGGWSGGCSPGELSYQMHGFVGTSEDRAWAWVGEALVEINGETGVCSQVLNRDPNTAADLFFIAAVPWVDETPSKRTMVALVQTSTDPVPYVAAIDLDLGRYTYYQQFRPDDAEELHVIGVGANPDKGEGFVLLTYLDGGRETELLVLNKLGDLKKRVSVDLDDPESLTMLGQMQGDAQGNAVGLLSDGTVLFYRNGKVDTDTYSSFDVQGIYQFEDSVYLTGEKNDRPVIGKVAGLGQLESLDTWEAAFDAAKELSGTIKVLDERTRPNQQVKWKSPDSAIGRWPLISPYPLDPYAQGTSSWLIAGPGFDSTAEPMTAVAWAPVGVAVP